MVGPGTGVAAFRSVIQERAQSGQQMVLVFGCRSEVDDFYYSQEWAELKETQGVTFTLLTAFSRSNPDEGKMYVQHRIKENFQLLGDLIINKGAYIYVSGRAKFMPTSVEKAFIEVIKKNLNSNDSEDVESKAKEMIGQMKK